jgi:hypothetical protein
MGCTSSERAGLTVVGVSFVGRVVEELTTSRVRMLYDYFNRDRIIKCLECLVKQLQTCS